MMPAMERTPRSRTDRIRRESSDAPPAAQSPWVRLRSATYHPFVFQRMLAAADPAARPGDIVSVYDKSGALFGRGFYNPRSQIALRMLAHGDVPIDDDFLRQRIATAVALRRELRLDAVTDAYRLIHAEGDALSGLIAERYADCLVFELFSLGVQQRIGRLGEWLAAELGPPASLDRPDRAAPAWRIVVRADEGIAAMEGFRAPRPGPEAPASVVIREHGIRYRVDLLAGHKTGFFCDQRENRRRFAALCEGATLLDLCCYSGGFSLCARILGKAREVVAVDLDEAALAQARENANLNSARVEFAHADAFLYLRQMIANGRQFDRVVLDPPKLALGRNEYDDALRKYHDLNSLAVQVVRPGGLLLTCSCSGLVSNQAFIETVHRAARRGGRTVQMLELTSAGPDHPVMLNCPESAYLKALWLRVL